MLKSTPKRILLVLVAVVICMAFSHYFHRQAAQPIISSLTTNEKQLHVHGREEFIEQEMTEGNPTKESVTKQKIPEIGNTEKPRGLSGALPTKGGIWHGNYTTMKYDTGNLVGLWRILNKSYVEEHLNRPQIGDYICEDALCSEFLTEKDLKQVDRCANRFIKQQLVREGEETLVPTCHFINGTSRASKVALISFPGSGNTWTRGLLEKATGICTGEGHNLNHGLSMLVLCRLYVL